METRFRNLCARLDRSPTAALVTRWWGRLDAAHSEAQRRYHTWHHLAELFALLDAHGAAAGVVDDVAIALAIFFHDAVYDCWAGGKRGANERNSAALWDRFAADVALGPALHAKVHAWIIMTIDHRVAPDLRSDDVDARFFMDIDMAILGKPWKRYETYAAQILEEYAFHWPPLLWIGRMRFLRAAAAAPTARDDDAAPPVYATVHFRTTLGYERRARANAARELGALKMRLAALFAPLLVALLLLLHLRLRPQGVVAAVLRGGARLAARGLPLALAALLAAALGLVPAVALAAWWTAVPLAIDDDGAVVDARRSRAASSSSSRTPLPGSVAVFAGSFNPAHRGHLAVVEYLASTHAALHVVVGVNASKPLRGGAWELERRRELLEGTLAECALGACSVRVVIVGSCGARQHQWAWIHEYARAVGASRLYRGVRTLRQDLSSELALALSNIVGPLIPCVGARGRPCRSRLPLPTRYVLAPPALAGLSSTKFRTALTELCFSTSSAFSTARSARTSKSERASNARVSAMDAAAEHLDAFVPSRAAARLAVESWIARGKEEEGAQGKGAKEA